MTNDELNNYILHYLTGDKTKSAIMLTAPWGTGKSYYIQNELKPFLEREENGKHDCVVVSLYGIKDTTDISKNIYFELRNGKIKIWLNKKINSRLFQKIAKASKELVAAGESIGSTIFKGITGQIGFNFDVSDKNLIKLYKSINLSGKLVILEDLERSNIDILEVLGYVNNLVEQDGVKVLLVANENEILRIEDGRKEFDIQGLTLFKEQSDDQNKLINISSGKLIDYKYTTIKEKTVSDTVIFEGDCLTIINQILKQFDNTHINDCIKNNGKQLFEEIYDLMNQIENFNFRSLIFACQKTVNIFEYHKGEINNDYFKAVFLSIIAFSLRLKQNAELKWTKETGATMLGTDKYPLYKFCYDYIRYHEFQVSEIKKNEMYFLEQKDFEEKTKDMRKPLNVLYSFYTSSQELLESALRDIFDKLCNGTIIPETEFGKLINYLIIVRDLVDCPEIIDKCKNEIINILSKGEYDTQKVTDCIEIYAGFSFLTDEQKTEYNSFVIKMKEIIDNVKKKPFEIEYSPENFDSLIERLYENKKEYFFQHTFINKFDIDKLLIMIASATSKQIDSFRKLLLSVYYFYNLNEIYADDKETLIKLKFGVKNILDSGEIKDKIILTQLKLLIENLSSIIEKF